MKRLLITGAAGGLGQMLRGRLGHLAETLRLSDVVPLQPNGPTDEVMVCDLADEAAVFDVVAGCDGIVHLGGVSVERGFDVIDAANLRGIYNLYEAARANGQPRIIFASSNHTIGFYPQDRRLGADDPVRPDGLYGVSKVFGEAMARMYYEKFGQETAIIRIGSCTPEPTNWRMLSTWLSHDDLVSLIETAFRAPRLGCPIIWGASANDAGWWDNSASSYLGWVPRDNAADHLDRIAATVPRPAPDDPVIRYQGGSFAAEPIHRNPIFKPDDPI
ncbi:NAD(P)-dependent oxidoreductase [Paracoccus sp. M683]|uniref:NAD-dependent epimerase/dehydratase family protein n=1 Tax=Paracoccus sp. M683 TaxID=2594268 RepID=UPI00117EE735|nr:NAD(P)-dependent oxidoreductase [Paracoccus sp. M683]TRW99651.1 NAD(P)-dependent oxidoreductase [Paracoccus sp. M683]